MKQQKIPFNDAIIFQALHASKDPKIDFSETIKMPAMLFEFTAENKSLHIHLNGDEFETIRAKLKVPSLESYFIKMVREIFEKSAGRVKKIHVTETNNKFAGFPIEYVYESNQFKNNKAGSLKQVPKKRKNGSASKQRTSILSVVEVSAVVDAAVEAFKTEDIAYVSGDQDVMVEFFEGKEENNGYPGLSLCFSEVAVSDIGPVERMAYASAILAALDRVSSVTIEVMQTGGEALEVLETFKRKTPELQTIV